MADQLTLQLIARIGGVQFLVAQLFRMHYEAIGATDEQVAAEREKMKTFSARYMTAEHTSDPAMSDHMSAEIAESIDSVLEDVERLVRLYRDIRGRGQPPQHS